MKKEYREIFKLPPTILRKRDLFELEKLIGDEKKAKLNDLDISLIHNEKVFEAKSFSKIFEMADLPEKTDSLTIDFQKWKKEDVISGISLTLYKNYISCQIHSTDPDWFEGKRKRIQHFFKTRKPWFFLLNRIYPFFALIGLLYFLNNAEKAFISKSPLLIVEYLGGLALTSWSIYLYFKDELFPYVTIQTNDEKSPLVNLNNIVAVAAIGSFLEGLIQIIISLVHK